MAAHLPDPTLAEAHINSLVSHSFASLEPRRSKRNHNWHYLLLCLQRGDILFSGGSRFAANTTSQNWETGGWTPLHFACYHGKADYAGAALSCGAAADARTSAVQDTPLHTCARRGDRCADAARVVLRAGANPAARNSAGRTPLHEAARMDSTGVMRILLEWGAPPACLAELPSAASSDRDPCVAVTPLWDAVHRGNLGAARLLVEVAGVNLMEDLSSPPLRGMAEARGYGSLTCLNALLRR